MNSGITISRYSKSATLFKHGSGVGADWSTLRSTAEKLTGGGTPSGPVSFMKVQDATGGTIQPERTLSTEAVIGGSQLIYTVAGPSPARDLASQAGPFVALVYDRTLRRYTVRHAWVVPAGEGPVVRVTTDKGAFHLGPGLIVGLSPGGQMPVSGLSSGRRLFACTVDLSVGYPRVGLRDGMKGKEHLHRMVAREILGEDIEGRVVHHLDEDKTNAAPENLCVIDSQAEHAKRHGLALAEKGEHVFQTHRFPKHGRSNPMHRDGDFWKPGPRSSEYRAKKRAELVDRDPVALQAAAVHRRALNVGHQVRDAGHDPRSMEDYLRAHEQVIGRICSKPKKRESLIRLFGSFEGFVAALDAENHKVLSVSKPWEEDRFTVVVSTNGAATRKPAPFVVWPLGNTGPTGSGVAVRGL